jgi:hypothetical protein
VNRSDDEIPGSSCQPGTDIILSTGLVANLHTLPQCDLWRQRSGGCNLLVVAHPVQVATILVTRIKIHVLTKAHLHQPQSDSLPGMVADARLSIGRAGGMDMQIYQGRGVWAGCREHRGYSQCQLRDDKKVQAGQVEKDKQDVGTGLDKGIQFWRQIAPDSQGDCRHAQHQERPIGKQAGQL